MEGGSDGVWDRGAGTTFQLLIRTLGVKLGASMEHFSSSVYLMISPLGYKCNESDIDKLNNVLISSGSAIVSKFACGLCQSWVRLPTRVLYM